MELEFEIKGQLHKISIEKRDGKIFVDFGNKKLEVDYQNISENSLSLLMENESYTVFHTKSEEKKYIFIQGEQYIIEPSKKAKGRATTEVSEHGEKSICAPMPGRVLKILVKEGEKVRKNQSLAIVEAMKMENEIKSPFEGVVKKINFAENQIIDTEEPILELEKEEREKQS
jgi:biotin carboxyl carrier protein